MFFWISLAVVAQCINAGVAVVDKYIVTSEKIMPRPFVYAFYSCVFAGAWVFVFILGTVPIPFLHTLGIPTFAHVSYPTLDIAALSLLSSYTFFIGLVSLYSALKSADASDVVPVVGAVSAVVSFGLGYFFLDAHLTPNFLVGLLLLSMGTFLVSHLRFNWKTALTCLHAGIFFAIYYVVLKGLFNHTSFDNGFFWSRVSFFVVALSMLLVPHWFEKVHTQTKATNRKGGLLVLANKFFAGIGSILILKATALGSVPIVQALGGLQFVLILLFGLFWGHCTPPECGENLKRPHEVYHKVIFTAMITVGFCVLFV